MIAVTFAVPHESRDFRRALRHASRIGGRGWLLGNIGLDEVLVVHTGIGLAAAEESVGALLAEIRPRFLIAAGYAGALDPSLPRGSVFAAANFSAPDLLAKCACPRATLTTASHAVESVEAKAALRQTTGAQCVDMETSAIARVAHLHRIPMLALRAISDTAREPLPVPFATTYDLTAQRPRVAALARHLFDHPLHAAPFARFIASLADTRAALTDALLAFLK